MRSTLRAFFLAIALTCPSFGAGAQQTHTVAPTADFFSGTVLACSAKQITVNRKSLGRDSVTRTFLIDENTKVEGKLVPKAHVTVRFMAEESGTRALHIIVR